MTNEELVCLIQSGTDPDNNNLGVLYQQNKKLIKKIVLPFTGSAELDDLMQEAFFGLSEAVSKYDQFNGSKFMTYASYYIRRSCIRYAFRNNLQSVPVQIQKHIYKYKDLEARTGRRPDKETVRKELGLSEMQYKKLLEALQTDGILSLECPINEDGLTLSDTVSDGSDLEKQVIEQSIQEGLKDVWKQVKTLPEGQKDVILRHYKDGESKSDIAKKQGVSRQTVTYLERTALSNLSRMNRIIELADSCGYDCKTAYSSGLSSVKQGFGSSVERLAIKHIGLEQEYKRLSCNIETLVRSATGSGTD